MSNTCVVASVLLFVVVLVGLPAPGVRAAPIRVACRRGQAPFNDAVSDNSTTCDGLFGAIFYRMIELSNISYTFSTINTDSFDPLLTLDPVTNTSRLDMVITFHTITPARLRLYDFSLAMFESADAIALAPKFKKDNRDLTKAVIRRSVMYVWAVISTLAAGMTVVIVLFEWKEQEAHGSAMAALPFWKRFLWSGEMGLETVLTVGTSEDINSQIVRSVRGLVGVSGVACLAIFGAVISSQLTTAALQKTPATYNDIGGSNLAISSSTLRSFIQEQGASTTLVGNMNDFAARFYSGQEPTYDGFVASENIVNYLHNLNGAADGGFTVSEPFLKTGVPDLRAFPMSFAMDPAVKRRMVETFARMRDSGEIATMTANYVISSESGDVGDIPISDQAQTAVQTVVIVLFSLMAVYTIVMIVYTLVVKKKSLDDVDFGEVEEEVKEENRLQDHSAPTEATQSPAFESKHLEPGMPNTVTWRGRTVDVDSIADPDVLDAFRSVFELVDRKYE